MIVDSMSKQEVMGYIRKEYNSTILPYFHKHLKLYQTKIYPVCERGKREKVICPWETVMSKDRTVFQLQVFGNKEGIDSLTIAEFDWHNQHCFAYIKHELLVIFSEHTLRRYEERVLETDRDTSINVKQTFKRLMKYIPLSYRTILPSPTHPLCYYFVVPDALFLGDFDEASYYPDQNEGEIWLNTCISLKEASKSQKGILNTLSLLPFYIKQIGFNPFDREAATSMLRDEFGIDCCVKRGYDLSNKTERSFVALTDQECLRRGSELMALREECNKRPLSQRSE